MKTLKTYLLILGILLIAFGTHAECQNNIPGECIDNLEKLAWNNAGMVGTNVEAEGSCTTSNHTRIVEVWDSPCDSDDGTQNFWNTTWKAPQIVFGSDTTVTRYRVRMYDLDGADSAVMQLYDNNATPEPDEPDEGSPIANTDVTISHTLIGGSAETVDFDLGTPTLVTSGTYWLIGKSTGAGRFRWVTDTGGCTPTSSTTSDSGSNWTEVTNLGLRVEVYGCQ